MRTRMAGRLLDEDGFVRPLRLPHEAVNGSDFPVRAGRVAMVAEMRVRTLGSIVR